MLLKALAKSNDNLFAIAFKSEKSDNYRDTITLEIRMRDIKKEAKNWYQKGCK